MSFDLRSRLKELHAENRPTMDWRKFITVKEGSPPLSGDTQATFNDYFGKFLDPGPCPGCQREFGGGIVGALMGAEMGFAQIEWGMANGEAYCVVCRYPYRVYHRNVGPIEFMEQALAYHPSGLSFDETPCRTAEGK